MYFLRVEAIIIIAIIRELSKHLASHLDAEFLKLSTYNRIKLFKTI